MSVTDIENKAVAQWSQWGTVKRRWATFIGGAVVGFVGHMVLHGVFHIL